MASSVPKISAVPVTEEEGGSALSLTEIVVSAGTSKRHSEPAVRVTVRSVRSCGASCCADGAVRPKPGRKDIVVTIEVSGIEDQNIESRELGLETCRVQT